MKSVTLLIFAVIAVGDCSLGAEPRKSMHRIGLLAPRVERLGDARVGRAAFIRGLRDLGYIEGQNIMVENRYSDGKPELFPELAADLVRQNVSVIVAVGPTATGAAIKATKTIPIVMAGSGNPVDRGFVKSLSSPGGNVTGLSSYAEGDEAKRMELLKETFPRISRIAVLNPDRRIRSEAYESVAKVLGVEVQSVQLDGPEGFPKVFNTIMKMRCDALITVRDILARQHADKIAELALKNRLPSMFEAMEFVQAGGLMSYGISYVGLWRRAAVYVDKILKGANPATLPVGRHSLSWSSISRQPQRLV